MSCDIFTKVQGFLPCTRYKVKGFYTINSQNVIKVKYNLNIPIINKTIIGYFNEKNFYQNRSKFTSASFNIFFPSPIKLKPLPLDLNSKILF